MRRKREDDAERGERDKTARRKNEGTNLETRKGRQSLHGDLELWKQKPRLYR